MDKDPFDTLLAYHDTPPDDDFTVLVMQRLKRQQQVRRAILWGTGVVGAAFGAAGALTLSEPLGRMMSSFDPLAISAGLVGLAALAFWLFQDETTATG